MVLLEKARELGETIGQTEEYRQLQTAQEQLDGDEVAKRLIQEVQSAQKQMELAQNAGASPSPQQLADVNDKRQQVNDNPTVQLYIQAQTEFTTLMNSVNQALTEAMSPSE